MQLDQIVAVYILALSCSFFTASCTVAPAASDTEHGASHDSSGTDPTGEAREPLPIVHYKPTDFPFVTTVLDDGEGDGGGWQVANATLDFWKVVIPHLPRRWECSLAVEMPLRTKFMGRVPQSRAATLSVEIAEAAARIMDYDLPPVTFCKDLVEGMRGLFASRYPKLGARVKPR